MSLFAADRTGNSPVLACPPGNDTIEHPGNGWIVCFNRRTGVVLFRQTEYTMGSTESHFGRWVVRHRWWIIAVAVPALAVSAAGISRVQVTNNTRVFFGEHNPEYLALKALEHTYSREQAVFFILAPGDGNLFTRENLTTLYELTEACWQIPYCARVSSLTNFPHFHAEGDDLLVEKLVSEPAGLSQADVERIRGIAMSDTALVPRLISPSGDVAGIYVGLAMPPEQAGAVPEVTDYTQAMVDDFRARHPGTVLHLTGSVTADQAFAQASRDDLLTLAPMACAIMVLLVGVALRSFFGTFAAVVVTVASMLTALGLTGWLGIPLNAVSVGAPGLILTLAIADNVHILTTMFHLVRRGRSKYEAVAESVQSNMKAIILTSVTTIIGFLSMNFSESPPFRDLGNLVGMGVTIDLFNSILLLPALMAVLPMSVRAEHHGAAWLNYERVIDFVIRRRELLLRVMLVVAAVASLGILQVELDDNFLTYFDDSFEFRRATDFLIEHLGGWDVIEYSLSAGQSGGIAEPEYLAVVDRFAQWYRRQPRVAYVGTLVDTMKKLNRDMHGGDESYYRIPEQRDLAAQYLLFCELSLPAGHDLNSQIDIDKSATRFTVVLDSMSARELREMDKRAGEWLGANAPAHMVTPGTGLSLIWAHITERNVGSMLAASLGEIVLISGIMIVALRSLKYVVIFLIPNVLPPFIAFGIWGMTRGRVGLALSVVVAMTLGIIVDDTIHFFVKYFRARRDEGMTPPQAVRYAFETVGAAIGITTTVLVAGFLVMTFSHYRMSSEMGVMCAMTVGLALLVDFFLSPALLMKVDRVAGTVDGQQPGGCDDQVIRVWTEPQER